MASRALPLLLLVLAVLAGTATCAGPTRQLASSRQPEPVHDERALAAHLSSIFAVKAISEPAHFDAAAFLKLHDVLAELYPLAHQQLGREVVAQYSLLYTWKGTDTALPPAVLTGHLDAAPIEPGGETRWTHPPFDAAVADGFVWARGVMHSRFVVFGLLEAAEALLAEGYRPRRTIYFAFGHDDDLLGNQGAAALGRLLKERGVRAAFVLEEGGMLVGPEVTGMPFPVAQLAIAEKGYLTVTISASGSGGHSSMVQRRTAIDELAVALARLDEQPFAARVTPPVAEMARALAPEIGGARGMVLAEPELLSPLLIAELERQPQTNALVRTTKATTMIDGGVKDNVLPTAARATLNFRLLPGDTAAGVLAAVRERLRGRPVTVEAKPGFAVDPMDASGVDTAGFRAVATSIRQVYPEVRVVPALLTAITDIRHYAGIATDLYRFNPIWVRDRLDVLRLHGVDERVAVADLAPAVRYYGVLLRNAAELR